MNPAELEILAAPSGPLVVAPGDPAADAMLSLIVPTFNEGRNIRDFLAALREALGGAAHEAIVVDDDSPDGTWRIAAEFAPRYPQLRVMRRRNERGLAAAVIRGWQAARGGILGTINADFQHPPSVLPRMLAQMDGADLVVASRHAAGGSLGDWKLSRRVASRGAHLLGRLLLPEVFGRLSDPLSGCYLFRRSALAGVALDPLGFKTLMEIMVRGRIARVAECAYEMRERRYGRSKAAPRHSLEFLRHLLRLRAVSRSRPKA